MGNKLNLKEGDVLQDHDKKVFRIFDNKEIWYSIMQSLRAISQHKKILVFGKM